MSDNTPTFDFDAAPASGQTLTDQQPERSASGGGYSGAPDVDMGDLLTAAAGPTDKKGTQMRGSFSAPKLRKNGTRVAFDIVAFEPAEFAGFESTLWISVADASATEIRRDLSTLAKLCKVLGVSPAGRLPEVLDRIAEAVAGRDDLPYTLKPKNNGGHFVNL